ncbi:hypothetical protein ID866_7513 [Astraeus odoratus]|nr:hypothetical protein ID866_7513 [Astraeus odoratus]
MVRSIYRKVITEVLTLRGWIVILNREHLEDIASKYQAELSLDESTNNAFKVKYTFGSGVHHDRYHHSIIQSHLNRNLASLCPDIKEEMVNAFSEILGITENEWKTVPAFESVRQIVSRTSNRVFVGLPLCRDPSWNDFTVELTATLIKEVLKLRLFPAFVVPLQNDFLQWCLDAGKESSIMLLTQRIMVMNFAAIHVNNVKRTSRGTAMIPTTKTLRQTFTQALYHLAANPQYVMLLREEVDTIIEKYGWTKEALGKMRKVDSFLKETLRCQGVSWQRLALKDIKLSDGTFLPKGTRVQVAKNGIHHDPGVYDNADIFEPFRFADLGGDGEGYKYQMVTVNSASLSFGYGKMACPGRFLAATILKMMLAYIVLSFDVKLDASDPYPRDLVIGSSIVADPKARVMFRKRSDP